MKIQVIGSGCPTCKNLYELTKTAVTQLGIKAEVEYSTDVTKIVEMGLMESPVLTIDGKPAMTGAGNLDKIKAIISKGVVDKPEATEKPECTCGGNCC